MINGQFLMFKMNGQLFPMFMNSQKNISDVVEILKSCEWLIISDIYELLKNMKGQLYLLLMIYKNIVNSH